MRSAQRLWERIGPQLVAGEAVIGQAVSNQITAHHARRLRALGWEGALNPEGDGWAECAPPPRAGNAIEILVDGAEALPAIADALQTARSHVHVTGWYFSPDFALVREGAPLVFGMCSQSWPSDSTSGSSSGQALRSRSSARPGARSSACETSSLKGRGSGASSIRASGRFTAPTRRRSLDDRVAFVGGIDLTYESGDRYDLGEHPARASVGWHDAAARIEVRRSATFRALRMRWHEGAGEVLPLVAPSETAGDVELQVVRTVPEKIYDALPRGDFGILEAYMRAFQEAERFIYVENQFLWSPEIARVLREKLLDPLLDDFRMLFVLPSKPNSGRDDTRGVLAELVEADADRGRLLACTIYARSGRSQIPSTCTRRSRLWTTAG